MKIIITAGGVGNEDSIVVFFRNLHFNQRNKKN